jgi:hypothetical protein
VPHRRNLKSLRSLSDLAKKRTTVRPGGPFARTPVRDPARRIITRNSFEIYEDQMEALRKRPFQEKLAGQVGSMSAMVRAAIDSYLEEHPAEP